MLPMLLAAALAAATGVHIEETTDVSLGAARELAEAFTSALQARMDEPVRLDDPDWPSCDRGDHCLTTIRARTDTRDVVLLRVFAGPTMIRVVALRFEVGSAQPAQQVSVDLPRERAQWDAPLAEAARQLHPEPRRTDAVTVTPIDVVPPPPGPGWTTRWGPWLTLGASAVAASAGTAFALDSASAREAVETGYHAAPELDLLTSRVHDRAIAADVLFGVAIVGAVAGVTWLLAR